MKILNALIVAAISLASMTATAATPILGTPQASTQRMYQYVKSKNPGSSFTLEIAQEFHDQGVKYGIRGDIALCQSCVETGWFKYTGGTAVTPSDHNYCGLGVTQLGQKGCQFSTVAQGVSAQLQHLWAYGTTKALPTGWTVVDPRFGYVSRGSAPNWENLGSGKWASAANYGSSIISIYNEMMAFAAQEEDPKLEVSPASITLSGKQGGTAPSVNITVTGTALTSDISFNPSTGSVKAEKASGWNARTGGKITVTLDLTKAPGTYSGYLAVVSGSLRKEVPISATIEAAQEDPKPVTDPVAIPTSFKTDWEYSAANGKTSAFFNYADDLTRNMALVGDNLLVVRRATDSSAIYIVDAYSGNSKGTLPTGSIAVNNYTFSSVAALNDGAILACNMGFSATTQVNVYSWASVNAEPQLVLQTTNHSGRTGDLMCASGTLTDGKIYLTTNSGFTGYQGRVMVYTIKNGTASATPAVITLKDASGNALDMGGTFAVIEIRVDADGNLQCTGPGGITTWFKPDGTFIRQLDTQVVDGNVEGASAAVFDYGTSKLAFANTYKTSKRIDGYATLWDITSTPKVVKKFDVLSTSGAQNTTGVTTALARVDANNNIHLWTLVPKQGIAKYYAAATGSAADILAAPSAQITFNGTNLIVVGGDADCIAVRNLHGQITAKGAGNTLDINLQRGVYIATATLHNGTTLTRKFVVR